MAEWPTPIDARVTPPPEQTRVLVLFRKRWVIDEYFVFEHGPGWYDLGWPVDEHAHWYLPLPPKQWETREEARRG